MYAGIYNFQSYETLKLHCQFAIDKIRHPSHLKIKNYIDALFESLNSMWVLYPLIEM